MTGYSTHRELHSFPTRRSSDLRRNLWSMRIDCGTVRLINSSMPDTPMVRNISLVSCMDELISRDRKSTRLNSSHTVISYAVFCLKKKNTVNALANVYDGMLHAD